MWYKFVNDEWLIANKVEFPDGTILKDNKNEEKDGWFWSELPPVEYVEWQEKMNNFKI